MKPEQERVKALLTDTVTLLCKNGLQFDKELKVQGLLGITLDEKDVFVVHINETFGDLLGCKSVTVQKGDADSPTKIPPSPHLKRPRGGDSGGSGYVDLTSKEHSSRHAHHKRQSLDGSRPHHGAYSRRTQFHSPGSQVRSPHSASTSSGHGGSDSELDSKITVKTEPGLESADDKDAMKMTYADLSISDIQEGFVELPSPGADIGGALDSDGPPAKRKSMSTDPTGDTGSDSSQGAAAYQRSDTSGRMAGYSDDHASFRQGHGQDDMVQPEGQTTPIPFQHPSRPHVYYPSAQPVGHVCFFPGCGKSFTQSSSLYRHQREKHGSRYHLRVIQQAAVPLAAAPNLLPSPNEAPLPADPTVRGVAKFDSETEHESSEIVGCDSAREEKTEDVLLGASIEQGTVNDTSEL